MEGSLFILELSILLQGAAAVMALLIIPLSRRALAWSLLSVAFILMTMRRLLSWLAQEEIIGPQLVQAVHPEWVALVISILLVVGVFLIRTIFIQRNLTEVALRDSEERYALAELGSNDGLWDWNLKTDEVYFSPRWKTMLGYTESEIGNRPDEIYHRTHKQDLAKVKQSLEDHLSGKTPHLEIEYRMLHKNGHYLWVLSRGQAIRDKIGNVTRMAGSLTDISGRKEVEQRLIYEALHDRLTGLANRELFLRRLAQTIEQTQRSPDHLYAVLFIDLDRFKVLNDSRGHMAGDEMLITVARRIESCMRGDDLVARLGGDEFTVLLDPIEDMQQLEDIATRIQETISAPMQLHAQTTYTTASIGIAPSIHGYQRPEHILRDADTAMYHAKAMGKARHQVFNPKMHDHAVELMQLETDLRAAINQDEFSAHYQPIVSMLDGSIIGMEALLRWQHPKRGMVAPLKFIPLAEETGLIIPIGAKLFAAVCNQVAAWKARHILTEGMKVNINISSKQLVYPQFIEEVSAIILQSGIQAQDLALEVTESVLMENMEHATTVLKTLKSMGFILHMDDFGTGYSSLSYLHKFPVDGLKIDRSFIYGITDSDENQEIVKTIITLARSQNLKLIAEGVETSEQLELLRTLGCCLAQGYYFARPGPADQIEKLLRGTTENVHQLKHKT